MSALRRSAGETPIPRNVIETIQAKLRSGELPTKTDCPLTGQPGDHTLYFDVQCERSWTRGGKEWSPAQTVAFVFLFGWVGAVYSYMKSQPLGEFGRDTTVRVPLRVSKDAFGRLSRTRRQKPLREVLRHEPIYAQLLSEFPKATVTVVESCSIKDAAKTGDKAGASR